jgi:hypothetical protein
MNLKYNNLYTLQLMLLNIEMRFKYVKICN